MPDPFEIRRLAAGDTAVWREVRLAALQGSPEAFSSNYETEAARPLEAFAERLRKPRVVLAACREARIVGVAGLAPRPGTKERHRGFLWGIYVRPEARRLGGRRSPAGRHSREASKRSRTASSSMSRRAIARRWRSTKNSGLSASGRRRRAEDRLWPSGRNSDGQVPRRGRDLAGLAEHGRRGAPGSADGQYLLSSSRTFDSLHLT